MVRRAHWHGIQKIIGIDEISLASLLHYEKRSLDQSPTYYIVLREPNENNGAIHFIEACIEVMLTTSSHTV